ncbi:hypothetical protein HOH87_07080 [bacterium]|jgi:hypothetical protein|nr:hypothetical protein [bacterium]
MSRPTEKDIRQGIHEKLKAITDKYKVSYDELESFFRKIHTYKTVINDQDYRVLGQARETFFAFHENLKVLGRDLGRFDSFDKDEQRIYFEVSNEVISRASEFLHTLPQTINSTEIGNDIEGDELPNNSLVNPEK